MSLKQYQGMTKLGQGSFGVVYKAKLKKTNQIFVIKQIEMSNLDSRLKKWAMNQAKLMKEFNSPYIVKYFNSFVESTKLYIVMEYCVKGDLCKFIKSQMGKPIKEEVVWKFTIQIMIGLHSLHSQKILHRDIKTLNIFLDENSNVRIGDLGTAKTLNTDFTSTVVGTPYYLSPQICQQKPYNEKTDIWAFGCMVYQLCTGRHPFEAQNQAALALKIVMGKFKDIPSFYSKDLKWIIQSCLSVDYKRRPSINFLMQRPFVIEQANKLNLTLPNSQTIKKVKIETQNKQKDKKDSKIEDIQAIVNNMNKKVDQAVKKVQPIQKPPIPQVKENNSRKDIKVNQQDNRFGKKEYDSVKKNYESSLEKRKEIQKKYNMPPKNDSKLIPNKNQNPVNQNKSKQKAKIPNPPVTKVTSNQIQKFPPTSGKIPTNQVVNRQNVQMKKQVQNSRQVQIKKEIVTKIQLQKSRQVSSTNKVLPEKGKFTPTLQHENKAGIKKQFNQEDWDHIKHDESSLVVNLEIRDMATKKSIKNEQFTIFDEDWQKNARKAAFVNRNVQQQVDDDLLMAEFGITPEKKNVLNDFSLMKTKSINWDLDTNKNTTLMPQHLNKTGQNTNTRTMFKQLPTIKTNSETDQVSIVTQDYMDEGQNNHQQNEQNRDNLEQEEDDNQPYKSDDEQGNQHQTDNSKQNSDIKDAQQTDAFQQEEDSRYLIQNIQAQISSENKQAIEKQIGLFSKRLLENQKRSIHLENLKTHTEKEYFSHLSKQTYLKLKQQINSENDKEVDRLMKQLTKGKDFLAMKFLKIMGFEIEIERCAENVKLCKQKIAELKLKEEKGEWI